MTFTKPTHLSGASDAMRAFVLVVVEGSFVGAATHLGMTPSAVSKVISRLEKRLGTLLLQRTTRRIELTDAGRVFFDHSKSALETIEIAIAGVAALTDKPSGTVRVSVGSAFAKHRLVPILPAFHDLHPNVVVELEVSDAIVDPSFDTVDIAIRPRGETISNLHSTPLGESVRVLCAAPAYLARYGAPQKPDDLANHNCLVIMNAGFDRWPFKVGKRIKEFEVRGTIRANNADMLLDLALAGHGIVRLLNTILEQPLRNGALVPILESMHVADSRYNEALVLQGRQRLPRIAAFLEFLRDNSGLWQEGT